MNTYRQLVEQTARLAHLNKDQLLFFRGQDRDYRSKSGASTFYPTIYRDDYLPREEIEHRFSLLGQAETELVDRFRAASVTGHEELRRKKYIRWSILQHYGVCSTPLLDFTHSLRVACSFAQQDSDGSDAYVFIFGLPYLPNRISVNSEHDLVNVRLLSICPPDALRPYFQEGYLAGTEDITTDYDPKTELDFKNRLIAKFRIPSGASFWGRGFSRIPRSVLYPRGDNVGKLCESLELTMRTELEAGPLGQFLKEWARLESALVGRARRQEARVFSTREAIQRLFDRGEIDDDLMLMLNTARKARNQIVHRPETLEPHELAAHLRLVRDLAPRVLRPESRR